MTKREFDVDRFRVFGGDTKPDIALDAIEKSSLICVVTLNSMKDCIGFCAQLKMIFQSHGPCKVHLLYTADKGKI